MFNKHSKHVYKVLIVKLYLNKAIYFFIHLHDVYIKCSLYEGFEKKYIYFSGYTP